MHCFVAPFVGNYRTFLPGHGTLAFADEHFRRLVNGIQRGMAAQEAKCIVLTPLSDARNSGSLVTDIGRALLARGLKTVIVNANPASGDGPGSATLTEVLRADAPSLRWTT